MIPGELSKKRVFHFTTALVSLVPRQIMLGTKNEEKVQKGLSQTLDANNGAKKGGGGEGDERLLLLRSIAAFLESNGFSRSLKRFRSEAEIDTGKGQSLDLEHVFHEYIKKRGHPAEADVDCLKMQGSDNFKSPPVPNTSDSQPAETVTSKDKKEKKKKCKSVSENSELESAPQAVNAGKKEDSVDHETNGYLNKSDPGKENRSILNKGVDKHLDKTSKKRKRLGIEESKSQFENETLTKKSKKRKSKNSENNVETGLYTERSQVEEGHLGHDKKRKVDKFQEDLNKSLKVPLNDQTVGQIGDKEHQIFERNNVNNTTDKREPVKLGKNEGKHSAEPKTVNPFQRVKVDEVKFSDERLQNNSYWAKGGADGGYGAKAQEILGQVKGRDFRHEKTKKKRGTYRGGIIDLQSHSIKFNYSDDD